MDSKYGHIVHCRVIGPGNVIGVSRLTATEGIRFTNTHLFRPDHRVMEAVERQYETEIAGIHRFQPGYRVMLELERQFAT